jgi:hypothetical protein
VERAAPAALFARFRVGALREWRLPQAAQIGRARAILRGALALFGI